MPNVALPKQIKIVGKTYVVEEIPEMDEDCGACYDTKQLIKIAGDLPQELSQDTLLHEVMHAIDYQMHLNLKERHVSAMASGLMAVIKENPDFVNYLLAPTSSASPKAAATKHKSRKRLTVKK